MRSRFGGGKLTRDRAGGPTYDGVPAGLRTPINYLISRDATSRARSYSHGKVQ